MNQNDVERIYFNQNMLFFKDKIYNSNGTLEVSFCSSTTDYKTFSPPTLHISVIGENNLRRLCSLCYSDSVDLFMSLKDIMSDINAIYLTGNNNVVVKKYQYDRNLRFEFINIVNMNERVVAISVILNSSDFTKVIVPFNTFQAFYIGVLKTFVSEYVNISFSFTTRNLLTELLEQSKLIRNGIQILPSSLFEKNVNIESINKVELPAATEIENTIDDFNKFLGNDMENIKVEELEDKSLLEENKSKKLEINSLFITRTLNKDLSVFESMLEAASTKPDPINAIISGISRSINLDPNISLLPEITKSEFKSLVYISKMIHDLYLNTYIDKNIPIPSSFPILKYKINDLIKIDPIHFKLTDDLLLIFGFVKIFRSRIESRESDAVKNGALFYLKLRTILDPLVYSFIDILKSKIITSNICSNFEKYSEIGFFNHYQKILTDNKFSPVTLKDIREFCEELSSKIFTSNVLNKNILDKHNDLHNSKFLKIKSDNNLSLEQIINELIPLEILEKTEKIDFSKEDEVKNLLEKITVSEEVLNIFTKPETRTNEEKKKKDSNLLKTVMFFNNEIPEKYKNDFYSYINDLKENNYEFNNEKFEPEELGENIIKTLYTWNNSSNKNEPLTSFRARLEDCILSKEDILAKYKSSSNTEELKEEWNLDIILKGK